MRRPNFFILGAAKCGTTSLHTYLGMHPDVYVSVTKEPFFFEAEYHRGLKYYWSQYFSLWGGEKAVGEARHRNLFLPYVPSRIRETVPEAKLIIVVRNPIDRAYSHWWHWYSRQLVRLTFEDALALDLKRIESGLMFDGEEGARLWTRNLDLTTGKNEFPTYLDSGHYDDQIQRYLGLFPRENLKIVFFEDLATSPQGVVEDLCNFLELDDTLLIRQFHPENVSMTWTFAMAKKFGEKTGILKLLPDRVKLIGRKVLNTLNTLDTKRMKPSTRRFLVEHYYPHNRGLERLTGRDLSCWDR